MSDTMAADPKVAQAFMLKVWPGAVARVKQEVADMQAIADREQPGTRIEPWDYLYFAEKVRKAKYDLDEAELKPYFELNNMVSAALWSAERRFGLAFKEITGTVPVFHPDVRVWEVTDKSTGRHRALFYLDNFARAGKRSGAWASSYRSQNTLNGGDIAHVEQQQLRERRAGRAGADLAERCANAVSRIRSCAAQHAAERAVSQPCRRRRATTSSFRRS